MSSKEKASQLALRDNIERRQLSTTGKAKLANQLWKSYDRPDNGEKREGAPRRRAALAAGLSEGTLRNFRAVLDAGFVDIIDDMLSEKITIDAAHKKAESRVDGKMKSEAKKKRMARAEKVLAALKKGTDILDEMSKLPEQLVAHVPGAIRKGNKSEQERFRTKLATARAVLEKFRSDGTLTKLGDAIAQIEAGAQ